MNAIDPYLGAIKAVIVIAFMLGLVWVGHHYGARGVQQKWDKAEAARLAAENSAIMTRIRNNERIAEQQEINNQRIKKDHANEIAKIHAAYATAGRLRLPKSVCDSTATSTNTESASGGNANSTGAGVFPEPYNGDLRALMQEADMIVASCRAAQEFIKSNGLTP